MAKSIPTLTTSQIKSFWNRVRANVGPDDCWLWHGAFNRDGYGTLDLYNEGVRTGLKAHRLVYFLHYEVDPGELLVCHRCDVRACCNPRHLFLGDHQDNVNDAVAKGRFSKNTKAKTEMQILNESIQKMTAKVESVERNVDQLYDAVFELATKIGNVVSM